MKTLCNFGMILLTILINLNFVSCTSEKPKGIPQSFKSGSRIHFISKNSSDGYASYGFDWFVANNSTKCQWAGSNYNGGNIAENFSSAQYEYIVTGEHEASLTSVNYQSLTGRVWYITITMFYETETSGTYSSQESMTGGKTHNLSGVFEIQ